MTSDRRMVMSGVLRAGLASFILVPSAFAQESPPTQPAAGELSVETIQQQLTTIEQDKSLEEGLKTRLLEAYRQTLGDLQRAADWANKAADFEKVRLEAPDRLEKIRVELAKPPAPTSPEVPPDASLQRLEQELSQAEAELKTAREETANLDQERKRRADRRAELPAKTAAAKQRLEEVQRELEVPPKTDEPPQVLAARKLGLQANRRALEEEIKSAEREVASYDARGDLLAARRDKAAQDVTRREQLVAAWQTIVSERRRADAEQAARNAERLRRDAARSDPLVKPTAEEAATWAKRRSELGLAGKIEAARLARQDLEARAAKYKGDYATVKSKVAAAGLDAMGALLRRQREQLPNPDVHRRAVSRRQSEISEVQVELINLEDELSAHVQESEAEVQRVLAQLPPSASDERRADLESAMREFRQQRRGYIEALRGDYDAYLISLSDLDIEERKLIKELVEFREYIDERILWVRSTGPPHVSDLSDAHAAISWLLDPGNWVDAFRSLARTTRARPFQSAFMALFILILLSGSPLFRRYIRRLGEGAAQPLAREYVPTPLVLVLSILSALTWPLIILAVGWALTTRLDASEFGKAVGTGLRALAAVFFLGLLLRTICRPGGLGAQHFGWSPRGMKIIRRHLAWLLAAGLPTVFLVATTEVTEENEWQNSLGRLAFVVGHVLLAIFATRVLRPKSGALRDALEANTESWLSRFRYVWYPLSVALPLALALLAVSGFYYTALRLSARIHTCAWLLLILLVTSALALRWVLVSRRKLALEHARAEADAERTEGTEGAGKPVLDLLIISDQTRKLVQTLLTVAFFVGLWVVWDDVLPAFGILENVELWSVTQNVAETVAASDGTSTTRWVEKPVPITLQNLGLSVLILLVTVVASRNIPGFLEIALLQRLPMKSGERYAMATIVKYAITVIGLVLGFNAIGIGWAKVQWLAAAMVVGLGFGLQEIFANFVSGLILLFERPIRVGDTVTVGNVNGDVTRIQIRATTITDWDRKELIIPNREFVTGQVINWTLSDSILRVTISVGIAYGSDTKLAEEILYKVAEEDAVVLREPKVKVLFIGFGDSSLNFELRVFVPSVEHLLKVRHQLNMAIDQAFREAGIEIAFPQRDIHIRSIKDVLPIEDTRRSPDPSDIA